MHLEQSADTHLHIALHSAGVTICRIMYFQLLDLDDRTLKSEARDEAQVIAYYHSALVKRSNVVHAANIVQRGCSALKPPLHIKAFYKLISE